MLPSLRRTLPILVSGLTVLSAAAQLSTTGFLNEYQSAPPGTLLSHPNDNDSAGIGRTTTINYVKGWLIVGAEEPGSLIPGSDWSLRVYDISNPSAPARRYPDDFLLTYPNNRWHTGNSGWNAHGSAQSGDYLLPIPVIRVQTFGGPVEAGGLGEVPPLGELALGYNRSSQAGPWVATMLWYGTPDQPFQIQRASINPSGAAVFQTLATFDHVGPFGGGDWHPMFFGDLLIYARSGGSGSDGVVIYRLQYHNFEDADPSNDSITPQLVGSMAEGFQAYWPTLFSDGVGLYVIGSATDILMAADITDAAEPNGSGAIDLAASLTVPNFSNASYPVFQDQFGFIHNRKINMSAFIAGDLDPFVLTLNQGAPNNVDTSQMSLPLGNLWITGGYPNPGLSQGMAVWVHQQDPDTNPPSVTYHIPQANRTGYPRFAPLSFLLHEHPRNGGMRNGVDFAVRPVLPDNSLGNAVDGYLIHDFSGVVTFTPTNGLAADTTYQVDFFSDNATGAGFVDAAGNRIEAYTFRFSTGTDVNAAALPTFAAINATDFHPAPDQLITITATASGVGPFDYRFNFNGSWQPWSSSNSADVSFPSTSRERVLVQARDANDATVTGSINLAVLAAPTGPAPVQSSTMVVGEDPDGRRLWVVNPDANTVSVLDASSGEKIDEFPAGEEPRGITRDANGRYWITAHKSDEIRVLNPDGSPHALIPLAYGSGPFGIVASPDGQSIFATLYSSGELHRYNAAAPMAAPTIRSTFPTPRAIAVSGDGQRVLVTRFISPELEGQIGEFNGSTLSPVRTFRLSSANTTDGGDRAAGVPNYLAGIAISPDGTRASVVSKQDNVQRGAFFAVGDLTHETTVRAVISFLNLNTNQEIRHSRRDFDNSDSPSAVAYSPLGDQIFVTLQGNNRLVAIDALNLAPVTGLDTQGSTLTSPAIPVIELETGLAPQGVLVDPVSQRLFSQNLMGRTVNIWDTSLLLGQNLTNLPSVATTDTVDDELLSQQVLLGKRIFYNAADTRMSAEGYISCASCHIDGGHDGRTWDFSGRGEGLRRTTDLRGREGMLHGNVHWSGNFDEIQDFEHVIRGHFGGTGFIAMNPTEFQAAHPSPTTTKAGASPDLDAIAAYLSSLNVSSIPRSPHREEDGSFTIAALRGRDAFFTLQCTTCHTGASLTDSTSPAPTLHNVGTQSAISGSRLGAALTGIDTPTLHGLHAATSYFHHGLAGTLTDVFDHLGGTLLEADQAEILNPGTVTLVNDSVGQGGGGFERGAYNRSWLSLEGSSGHGVRFQNVSGGSGGPGRVALRYIRRYGDAAAEIRVNGVSQTVPLVRQDPDNGWQLSGWRWVEADFPFQPGATNTIEILQVNHEFQVDAVLVSTAADIALAAPHRNVLDLPTDQQQDLVSYLRQLDGRNDAGTSAALAGDVHVRISPSGISNGLLEAPFIDFDIVFSAPVTGLDVSDFLIGGSAGATLTHLSGDGTTYRLRLTGFTQNGTITIQLPPGVTAATGGSNTTSSPVELTYSPVVINDDLVTLSDEFDDPATLSHWLRNNEVEGWNADKLEQWNIDTNTPGHMRLMPYSSSWFANFTGAYTFKEVTGDFVVTINLDVLNRAGTGRPNSDFSLAGLLIRTPRGISAAAPQPDPGPAVILPWPPVGYTTDWQPFTENYIFLSYGFGSTGLTFPDQFNPARWHYEVKTTINGASTLYPRTFGVPQNEPNATLQIVRRGPVFLLLRRHGNGPWIIENRFIRNDMPATLQVGITTYTDWNTVSAGWNFSSIVQPFHQNRIANIGVGNPDLIADVDFFRIRRPSNQLDADDLLGAPVTGPAGPVMELSATGLSPYLGDPAAGIAEPPALTYEQWIGTQLEPAQLADPLLTDPATNTAGLPNVVHFLLGGFPATPPAMQSISDPGGPVLRFVVPRNPYARGWRQIIESSPNLLDWETIGQSDNGDPLIGIGVEGESPGNPPSTILGPGPETASEPRQFFRIRAERLTP